MISCLWISNPSMLCLVSYIILFLAVCYMYYIHVLHYILHVCTFIVCFRPKYVVPSQLLRSVRLVNLQFRGYGQQVTCH